MSERKSRWSRLGGLVGIRDLFALGGLAMVFHGLRMMHEPSAWIATGASLFLLGIASFLASARSSRGPS